MPDPDHHPAAETHRGGHRQSFFPSPGGGEQKQILNLSFFPSPSPWHHEFICLISRRTALPGRLELPTLRSTASRSNQLSYGSRAVDCPHVCYTSCARPAQYCGEDRLASTGSRPGPNGFFGTRCASRLFFCCFSSGSWNCVACCMY